MSTRAVLPRVLALAALLVAGIVVSVVADGRETVMVVGFLMMGLASILLVALAFYEVGRSEDRARARERGGP